MAKKLGGVRVMVSKGKATSQLLQMIQNCSAPSEALMAVKPYLSLPALNDYLKQLIEKSGMTQQMVFDQAAVERTMRFRIMDGTRQPSRNILLRVALALKLSIEQTQELLKVGRKTALYPRARRDALLIYCISRGYTAFQTEDQLLENGEKSLYVRY